MASKMHIKQQVINSGKQFHLVKEKNGHDTLCLQTHHILITKFKISDCTIIQTLFTMNSHKIQK